MEYEELIKLGNKCFEQQLSETLWIITDNKGRWELVDDATKKQISKAVENYFYTNRGRQEK